MTMEGLIAELTGRSRCTVRSPSTLPAPESELLTAKPPGTAVKSQLAAPLFPKLNLGLPAIAPPFKTVS